MIFLILYDIFFTLGLIIYFFHHLYHKKITFKVLAEKLTFYSIKREKEKNIWFHGVSVGEVLLLRNLIATLKKNYKITISSTTLSGKTTASKSYPSCKVIYFPFDLSFCVKRAIKLINPKIFISLETEIWPNLYYHLKKRNIPVIILNGRISDKAFRWYKKVRWIMRKILKNVDFIGVQNQKYKERFLFLGADEEKIEVLGNLKFSSLSLDERKLLSFQKKFSFLKKEEKLLIIAGSTHHPEEEIILEIYKNLTSKYNFLHLFIAPRHIERVSFLEKKIKEKGFHPVRISKGISSFKDKDIFLLDTVGDLFYFYSIADICFVGGSLINYGGHNILEPLYFSKPTLFGPFMENFKDIEDEVLSKKAAIKVKDKKDLEKMLERLIEDSSLREDLKRNASFLFKESKIILKKNLEVIKRWLR